MTRSLPTRIAAVCLPAFVLVSCAGSTSALPAKDVVARYDAVGAAVAAALQPSGHTWTAATSQRGVRADGSTCLYSTGSGWKPSPAVADGFILDDPGFVAARGALDQALTKHGFAALGKPEQLGGVQVLTSSDAHGAVLRIYPDGGFGFAGARVDASPCTNSAVGLP